MELGEPSDGLVRSKGTTKHVHRTSSPFLPDTSICATELNTTSEETRNGAPKLENEDKILCQRLRMTEEEDEQQRGGDALESSLQNARGILI